MASIWALTGARIWAAAASTFIRQRKEGLEQLIRRGVNKIVAVDQAMTGIRETVRQKLNTSVSGMAISSSLDQ